MAKKVPNPIDVHVGSRVRNRRLELGMSQGNLGSGLIDHSQKMTMAAMQIADMKVWAHRS